MALRKDQLKEEKKNDKQRVRSFSIPIPHLGLKKSSSEKEDKKDLSTSPNSTSAINKSLNSKSPKMLASSLPSIPPPSSTSRSSESPHCNSPTVSSGRYSRASSSSSGCTSTSAAKIEYSSAEILNNYTSDHSLLKILIRDNHLNHILHESLKKGMGHHTIHLNVEKKEYDIQPMSNNVLNEGIIELESIIEYELVLMPLTVSKQMIKFKCDPDKEGLNYSVIGLDGLEVNDFIPWSSLGDDFPRSNEDVLAQEEKSLAMILQHSSKHTRSHKEGSKEGLHYRLMVNGLEVRDFIPWTKLPIDFPIDEAVIIKEKSRTLPLILSATALKAYTPLYSVETIVPDEPTKDKDSPACYVLNACEQIGGTCGKGGKVIFAYDIHTASKENLGSIDSILSYSAVLKIISEISIKETHNLIETTKDWGQYRDNYYENETLFLFTEPLIEGCNLLDSYYFRDYTKNKDSKKHFVARRYVEFDQLIDRAIQILTLAYNFNKKTKKLHLDQKTENYLISSSSVLSLIDLDDSQTEAEIIRKFERKNLEKEKKNNTNSENKPEKTKKKKKMLIKDPDKIKYTYYGSPGYTLMEGVYSKKNEIFSVIMTIAESFSFLLYQTLLRSALKQKVYIDDFTVDEYKKMLADIFTDLFLMDEFKRDGIEHTWETKSRIELFNTYLAKRLKHILPEDLDKLRGDDQQITNLIIALCYILPRIIKEIIEPGTDKNPENREKYWDNIPNYIAILEKSKKDYYQLCPQNERFRHKYKMKELSRYARIVQMVEKKDEMPEFKVSIM